MDSIELQLSRPGGCAGGNLAISAYRPCERRCPRSGREIRHPRRKAAEQLPPILRNAGIDCFPPSHAQPTQPQAKAGIRLPQAAQPQPPTCVMRRRIAHRFRQRFPQHAIQADRMSAGGHERKRRRGRRASDDPNLTQTRIPVLLQPGPGHAINRRHVRRSCRNHRHGRSMGAGTSGQRKERQRASRLAKREQKRHVAGMRQNIVHGHPAAAIGAQLPRRVSTHDQKASTRRTRAASGATDRQGNDTN